jgi:hypothetical protein
VISFEDPRGVLRCPLSSFYLDSFFLGLLCQCAMSYIYERLVVIGTCNCANCFYF